VDESDAGAHCRVTVTDADAVALHRVTDAIADDLVCRSKADEDHREADSHHHFSDAEPDQRGRWRRSEPLAELLR
jgi:hypothetical protein